MRAHRCQPVLDIARRRPLPPSRIAPRSPPPRSCVEVGLGVALVLALQLRPGTAMYSIDALRPRSSSSVSAASPSRRAAGVDRRRRHVVEALRAAGAEVEDAGLVRMVEEVHVDLDHVVDGDEIAPLLAVAVAARALEQLDLARRRGTG